MTIIGPSITIRGEISSDESIVLHGHIQGPVVVRGDMLALSTGARVDGDIRGVRVMVEGTVNGPIQVSQKVELARTAKVEGNLAAAQVVVWDGAWFQGDVDMTRRTSGR
jgi:cytoskeletal protein CcmA (bactofilin family)